MDGTVVFISWGEHILPDIIASILHGELEYSIEQSYYKIYTLLSRVELQTQLAEAEAKLELLTTEQDGEPQPHRPARTGTVSSGEGRGTQQRVATLFGKQATWLATL